MTDADKPKFFTLIAGVYAFYGRDLSEFAGSVWWQAMSSHDFAAVSDALNRHCVNPDTGQFAPKPADIVKMLAGSTQDAALVAWTKVDRAVRQIGTYETVVFDDPLVHRVLHDMGGWITLGTKVEDEWPFVAKEFENRYRGYRMRSETSEYPRTLIGIAEAQNTQDGRASQPPVLVGNPQQARAVLAGGTSESILEFERPAGSSAAALLTAGREVA